MQKLNLQATKIFCDMLDQLNGKQYAQLTSEGFMPLSLDAIGVHIMTPIGEATLFSLSHTYQLNGDLMRDPEMCFFVIDKRKNRREYHLVGIYPQMYQQDNLGIYEESITLYNGTFTVIKKWQHGHCQFANQWMKNIRDQGFLGQAKIRPIFDQVQYKGQLYIVRDIEINGSLCRVAPQTLWQQIHKNKDLDGIKIDDTIFFYVPDEKIKDNTSKLQTYVLGQL